MADIIKLNHQKPKIYSVDVTQYSDNLMFTVNGIQADDVSLRKLADELEKIVHIIRSDVLVGQVKH